MFLIVSANHQRNKISFLPKELSALARRVICFFKITKTNFIKCKRRRYPINHHGDKDFLSANFTLCRSFLFPRRNIPRQNMYKIKVALKRLWVNHQRKEAFSFDHPVWIEIVYTIAKTILYDFDTILTFLNKIIVQIQFSATHQIEKS